MPVPAGGSAGRRFTLKLLLVLNAFPQVLSLFALLPGTRDSAGC